MRIVYVHDALVDNGAVRSTLDLSKRLAARGEDVAFFTLAPSPAGLTPAVDRGLRLVQGFSGRRRGRWELPRVAARLIRACRRADVIVCGSEVGPALVLGAQAARVTRTPYVTIVHADLPRAQEQWMPPHWRPFVRRAHRAADAVIAVTPELVAGTIATGVEPGRIHVVQNGIDLERVRHAPPRAPVTPPRITAVGRLSSEKGFDLLVRAHAAVRSECFHELMLIGSGAELRDLRRLAEELGVADSVRFPGFKKDPFPLLAESSAYVLSSRREGLPLALLEAMALGVPVIATRCAPEIDKLLGNGAFGTLVEPESVAELADAIRHHLREPAVSEGRAAGARRQIERYSVDNTAAGHLRVLRLVHGRRGGGRRQRVRSVRSRPRREPASPS